MDIFTELNTLFQNVFGKNYEEMVSSLSLIIILTTAYFVCTYYIKSHETSNEKKLRRFVGLRNSIFLILVIGMIIIWSGEIKTMILSITAMSAAIIIAFKEIILCFSGSLLIASNKLFSIGDHIELDGVKGKVIDKNFIYTRLSISDSLQLKEISIPNMSFITSKVINLSTSIDLQSYTIRLAAPSLQKIYPFGKEVRAIAEDVIGVKKDLYRSFFERRTEFFREVPENFYHIEYDLSDSRAVSIKLHYMSLPSQQQEIEDQIIAKYLMALSNEEKILTKYQEEPLEVKSENPPADNQIG